MGYSNWMQMFPSVREIVIEHRYIYWYRFDEITSPSKMKIFQTIQRHYVSLGISSPAPSSQKNPINTRVFIGFLLFGLNAASQLIYIIYVANDFMGYMEVICASSGSTIIFVCFAAIVHKMTLLFETIDSIEKLIDSREPLSSNLSFPFLSITKSRTCLF